MNPTIPIEPVPLAILLLVLSSLIAAAALVSRVAGGRGIPVMLVFLGLGMLAGTDGLVGIEFEDYELAFQIGTIALIFILFDGGLNTSWKTVRPSLAPSALLATLGVVITALGVALAARWLGFAWLPAILLGSVVASTDAAAVFSVLRGGGVHLRPRVSSTLELESGLNDPMAVILTFALTEALVLGQPLSIGMLGDVILQIVLGLACGAAVGRAGQWLLRFSLFSSALYPVLTLSLAGIAFAVPTLIGGSGVLAVYVAGLVLGHGQLPYRSMITRAHDFMAWVAQLVMFVMMGLLAFPSQLVEVFVPGIVVAMVLILVARPAAVWLCLMPFRLPSREVHYISWMGLRGAVPIILATYPMMANLPVGKDIFNIVLIVVVASALLQGGTARRAAELLGVADSAPPTPRAVLEVTTAQALDEEIVPYYVGADSPLVGRRMAELPFPPQSAAMVIVRGRDLVPPRGHTTIEAHDHVYVISRPEDREQVARLLSGASECC